MEHHRREKSKKVSKDTNSLNMSAYVAHIVKVYHKMANSYDRGEFLAVPLRKAVVKMARVKERKRANCPHPVPKVSQKYEVLDGDEVLTKRGWRLPPDSW